MQLKTIPRSDVDSWACALRSAAGDGSAFSAGGQSMARDVVGALADNANADASTPHAADLIVMAEILASDEGSSTESNRS